MNLTAIIVTALICFTLIVLKILNRGDNHGNH